jgi:rhamnulokinase
VEATAMGNILMQAKAAGEVKDIADLRSVVRNSVKPNVFEPK